MSSGDAPAVDRQALWRVVEQHYGEHPEAFVRSVLASGILRDADDVRREARQGEARHYNDVGFCDACGAAWPCPAAALADHDAKVWAEAYRQGVTDERQSQEFDGGCTPPNRINPYSQVAGGEGHVTVLREGRAELQAAIEALFDKAVNMGEPVLADDGVTVDVVQKCVTVADIRAVLADPDGAALREHDRQVLEAAERRMFGTEDGDLIGGDSEIPAGELRRLLWEPYAPTGGDDT